MRFALRTSVLVALLLALMVGVAQAEEPGCYFGDGRINAHAHRDCAAPVQIFLTDNEILVLTYDPSIANKPEQFIIRHPRGGDIPSGGNTVLAQATNPVSGRPVILSRLTTGEYQLNTFFENGTPYIVVWYAGNDLYHLDPATGQPLDGATPISVPGGATNVAVSPPPAPAADSPSAPAATDGGATAASDPGGPGLNNCRVTINRIVRLRAEPNTSSEIITRLPYRTSWQATTFANGWFRIVYQARQGWVSSDYVSTSGDCVP